MRRFLSVFLMTLLLTSLFVPQSATAAVTAQEWQWMEAAPKLEQEGDLAGAMDLWAKLVDSLKTHNYDACGLYAQKLARALDQQGRYREALAAFEDELACWGQFPDRGEWLLWDQRRVQQIRPELRAFVARPAAQEAPGRLGKHEPAFGTLLGGTIDKDPAVASDPSQVAQVYGKPYAMVLVYARWGETLPVVATRNAGAAGAALQVAWEPSHGLDAVTDSAYVHDFAKRLSEYGHPVFLRFAAEMNIKGSEWYGEPEKYKEKFALIAGIMRQEAPNVAMVWTPNYVGEAEGPPTGDYYPGDQWVDWVGINLYHNPYFLGDPTSRQMFADIYYQGKRTNPLDKVKPYYEEYSRRKPIMLAETGFGWANREPYEDHSAWAAGTLKRFYGYLPLLYPRIKAIAYFNVDLNITEVPANSHYLLSGNRLMAEAYRQATASDWYLGSSTDTTRQIWRPLEQATLQGPTRVATYVNLGDAGVSRVEYMLDGDVVATATALPWAADLNLGGLAGEHQITVRAYDMQDRLGVERTYRFDASAIRVDLDGRLLDFDQPPVNVNSRILVPVRSIIEALGAEVSWEAETRTVVAKRDGSTLRLQIDNPIPTRDGVPLKALDVPAQIIGNRTLVPARFVAENYDMDVKWDQATRTVIIRSKQ